MALTNLPPSRGSCHLIKRIILTDILPLSFLAPWLFYLLIGVTVLLGLIFLIAVTCYCVRRKRKKGVDNLSLKKPKKKKKVDNIEIRSPVKFQYTTGIQEQQIPFLPSPVSARSPSLPIVSRELLAPRSLPGSPKQSPTMIRRHSFDPKALAETLDPELYKKEEESRVSPSLGLGRICFSLRYERETEKLSVTLIKAVRLPARSGNVQPSPYVSISLLPDKKRRYRSKTQKGCNPEFDEEFVFAVPESDIPNRTLKFAICDYDRFSRVTVIGYVVFPLAEANDLASTADESVGDIWSEISEDELPVSFTSISMNSLK